MSCHDLPYQYCTGIMPLGRTMACACCVLYGWAGLGWNRMEWRLIRLVKGGRKEGRKERWGKGGEGRGGEG